MKVRKTLFASTLTAAICLAAVTHPLAQTAVSSSATPMAASAPTAVPALVPYSGVALSADSKPLAVETAITFLIFKDEQGGEPLFTETQDVVPDTNGHYKVQLGATLASGIPLDIFSSGDARWLEVQVAGQASQPRVLLVSVPYALKAADASTLGGLPASAYALSGTRSVASAAGSQITPDLVTDVTTTGGTSGYVPVFNGASTVVDSPVFVKGADIGIGTTTPAAVLDVVGSTILDGAVTIDGGSALNGTLTLEPLGTATATIAFDSQVLKIYSSAYNSSSKTVVNPRFEWQAIPQGNNTAAPTATLNLLSSTTSSNATQTGFFFNANGTINFAPGQTFPANSSDTAFFGGAGNSTSTGDYNTGTGFEALLPNTSGVANTADGAFSLISETSATANTAVGYDSLYHDTTGSDNAGLGYGALFWNSTGSDNTAVGTSAGPDSTSTRLSNSTAIGANATVSQSNSLVLGQTKAGNPGASFVNVGIGTAKPRSIFEAVVTAPEALGPTLTLTNSSANGDFGGSSIDFNTYLPGTTGTYNPSSRIEAFGDGGGGDSLWFLSNNDNSFGGPNQGLQLNMNIGSNGRVNIGTQDTDPNDFAEQLVVTSEPLEGNGEVAAIGAFGEAVSGATDSNGSNGVYAFGGDGEGNAQADFAGDGGEFFGGFTPESSSGPAGYGIYATGGVGGVGIAAYAGYFDGNINVTGTVFGGAKDFKIDHPLDPANKYLVHASVESSEMMNIYSGNVVTDELGLATVTLPDWFEAENTDFRYQLTVIGGRFAQAIISKEIANNQFTISTNATNVKVSWQVTAVRQDAYAKAHPLVVEETKPVYERGFYEHPELYGQPANKQTEWGRRPQQMQRMKAMREKQKLQSQQHTAPQLSHNQPASAINRNFPHPAMPAIQPGAPETQLKPTSQVETK